MSTPHQYKLKYHIEKEVGEFPAWMHEVDNEVGLADALLFASFIFPEDGSGLSVQLFSYDGRNNGQPVPDKELFQLMAALAARLQDSTRLSKWKRTFCRKMMDALRSHIAVDLGDET